MKKFAVITILWILLETIVYIATNHLSFFLNYDYQRLRAILSEKGEEADVLKKYLYTPYLIGTPNPNYKSKTNHFVHNKLGYRGEAFSLGKKPNIFRVLCLGGSTTYGFNLEKNEETYPAQLQVKLNRFLKQDTTSRNNKLDSVQVINAGIEGANMFVILAQYMYKYRQFKPNLVVVHEGINDAYAYTGRVYSPDYTHLRTNLYNFTPLPKFLRWCMNSNVFSVLYIAFNYEDALMINKVVDDRKFPQWSRCEKSDCNFFDKNHNAFYQNSCMLKSLCAADSTLLLFFPMTYNKMDAQNPSNADIKFAIDKHAEYWTELPNNSNTFCTQYIPETIPSKYYFDACHLNGEGNAIKAEMISHDIESILKKQF